MLNLTLNNIHQSSIMVAVRVRPFTKEELMNLIRDNIEESGFPRLGDTNLSLPSNDHNNSDNDLPHKEDGSVRSPAMMRPQGIRKVLECMDDKMLIFDPADRNVLNRVNDTILNSMYSLKRASRRKLRRNGGEMKFVFDKLFDEDSTQEEVYDATTKSLLDSVLDGFNGTVFAYGATGCGKTHTVSGTSEQPGIVFQAMQELFTKIDDLQDTRNFDISLSYLEIYNETIRDLLNPEMSPKKLIIREDSENRITVSNLSLHHPVTVQEVMDLVIRGNMNRTTSPTDANETSSRSHAVLQIHIMQSDKSMDLTMNHTFSTLSIIDLAGSERAASTKNRGQRLQEGANINRSLLALGNCINALCISDGTRRTCHIPYRDSKLTRLLKFSLGGNCKTVMIVCVSPSSMHYDETLNTLKYANRAKEIRTKVIRNQQSLEKHVGSYLRTIADQKKEIDQLRKREATIVELNLKRYRVSQEKIQISIEDSISNVIRSYETTENYQNAKIIKSLILCKRRFLQLLRLEISNAISLLQDNREANQIVTSCQMLNEQLQTKIIELETKFDSSDELDLAIKNCNEVSLKKLQEMENWSNLRDLPFFHTRLNYVSEMIRNEILVQASTMLEKLLQNHIFLHRLKSLSNCLVRNNDIQLAVNDLIKIDEEFETFGQAFLIHSRQSSRPPSEIKKSEPVTKSVRWLDGEISHPTSRHSSPSPTQSPTVSPPASSLQSLSFSSPPVPATIQDRTTYPAPVSSVPETDHQNNEADISMQDIGQPSLITPKMRNPSMRNSLLSMQLLSNSSDVHHD